MATKDKEKKTNKERKRWRDKGEERVIRRQHVGYKIQGKEKTSQGKRLGDKGERVEKEATWWL